MGPSLGIFWIEYQDTVTEYSTGVKHLMCLEEKKTEPRAKEVSLFKSFLFFVFIYSYMSQLFYVSHRKKLRPLHGLSDWLN